MTIKRKLVPRSLRRSILYHFLTKRKEKQFQPLNLQNFETVQLSRPPPPPPHTHPILSFTKDAQDSNLKSCSRRKRRKKKEKKISSLCSCWSIAYHTNPTLVSLLCPSFHTISMLLPAPLTRSSFPHATAFLPAANIPPAIPFSAFLLAVCISSRCFADTMAATRVSQFQPRNGIVAS